VRRRYDVYQFRNLEHDAITSTGFSVGDLDLTTRTVPVHLDYANGTTREVVYQLSQNSKTAHFEICGTA